MKLFLGQVFERLTVIEYVGNDGNGHEKWKVQCECGTVKTVMHNNLLNGRTLSCGCLKREKHTKHGLCYHPLYKTWENMIQRCTNPKNTHYDRYGGRGIKVDLSWRDFTIFLMDVGEKPSPELTLERINNNGNYERSNITWATRKEQSNNREDNNERKKLLASL